MSDEVVYAVKALPLRRMNGRNPVIVGYVPYVVASDGDIVAFAIQEHAALLCRASGHEFATTPEAAMEEYENAHQVLTEPINPYAHLVRRLSLPEQAG